EQPADVFPLSSREYLAGQNPSDCAPHQSPENDPQRDIEPYEELRPNPEQILDVGIVPLNDPPVGTDCLGSAGAKRLLGNEDPPGFIPQSVQLDIRSADPGCNLTRQRALACCYGANHGDTVNRPRRARQLRRYSQTASCIFANGRPEKISLNSA